MQPAPQPPEQPWRARLLNMKDEVSAFDATAPVNWALEPIAIPGTLAVVAGQGGSGKTWVLHEAAHAVVTATSGAGLRGRGGTALIVDAEMGRWLTTQRFAQQGYDTGIDVMDATGMNLTRPEDRQTLFEVITTLAPTFVGIDSLSALTSGADENSRETGDVVRWLRTIIHDAGAAGLLIHHAGWKEERTRGSSTIRDGADTVWYFKRFNDNGARELNCQGAVLKAPRWSRPPDPIYMHLRDTGGLESIEKPATAAEVGKLSQADVLRKAIARGEIYSQRDACEAVGVAKGNQGVRDLLEHLAHKPDRRAAYELRPTDGPAI